MNQFFIHFGMRNIIVVFVRLKPVITAGVKKVNEGFLVYKYHFEIQ